MTNSAYVLLLAYGRSVNIVSSDVTPKGLLCCLTYALVNFEEPCEAVAVVERNSTVPVCAYSPLTGL